MYDKIASTRRAKSRRATKKTIERGVQQPKKPPKFAPIILITDEQRFADFLQRTRGFNIPATETRFIKRKLPGEWKTVFGWQKEDRKPDAIWRGLSDKTKTLFRRELWGTIASF